MSSTSSMMIQGATISKLLTILKEDKVRVFCISATFEDKKEASEWLNAKIVEIPEQLRVVPIQYFPLDLTKKESDLSSGIIAAKNIPCLIFCGTKPHTKDRAEEICKLLKKKNDKETIVQEIKEVIGRDDLPETETSLANCIEFGVGFHHSDLNSDLREYVAKLFIDRKIDYLFCTTGLAYGVNFPAKTVVVADLSLYDFEERSSKPLPAHLFLQMAGRAGRIKFGKEGYCYVVLRKSNDFEQFQEYLTGNLSKATSHISRDDFFYKAILELIYSKRDTETEIAIFFNNSFFNFQASRIKNLMVPFNLLALLTDRMNRLCNMGFIEQMGLQYRLTPFGNVTLEYLFSGVSSPELLSFLRLNAYVKGQETLDFNFNYVHFLSKSFSDCRISKQPRIKVPAIEKYLQAKCIADSAPPEYSAYVTFNKWIENVNEQEIDQTCGVLSSNLSRKCGK